VGAAGRKGDAVVGARGRRTSGISHGRRSRPAGACQRGPLPGATDPVDTRSLKLERCVEECLLARTSRTASALNSLVNARRFRSAMTHSHRTFVRSGVSTKPGRFRVRRDLHRSIVHIPSPAISRLRTALSRRRHFVRIQTAEVNATKRLLRGVGWLVGTRASVRSASSWDRLLGTLAIVPELQAHIRFHRAVWQQAGEQVRAVDHLLGELARSWRDEVRRLETVPGVSPVVALTAVAVFTDVQRFASAKHVASYAGLVPSTYQSGACDRHGHITKRGSAELRTMLCEAAHHARRSSHPLHPYFMKLCARRGYKTAIIAVAHRLCRLLYALLRDGTDFQPTRLGVEEGPFTQTITRQFRLTPKPAGRLVSA
jgi:transposase